MHHIETGLQVGQQIKKMTKQTLGISDVLEHLVRQQQMQNCGFIKIRVDAIFVIFMGSPSQRNYILKRKN